jgi:hypothetical protein
MDRRNQRFIRMPLKEETVAGGYTKEPNKPRKNLE